MRVIPVYLGHLKTKRSNLNVFYIKFFEMSRLFGVVLDRWYCIEHLYFYHVSQMCILCHCLAPHFNGGAVPFKSPKDTVACDSDKKTIILSVPISPQPDDWSLWSKCKYTRRQSQKRGLVIMSDKWPLIAEQRPGWGEIQMWLSSRLQTSLTLLPPPPPFFPLSPWRIQTIALLHLQSFGCTPLSNLIQSSQRGGRAESGPYFRTPVSDE